ncbi:MAG: hypothetical protein QOJ02_2469 [Acidobacteriota bacterium]|nr:hypothetical protein [Acidobacteriota bacterium]
MRKNFGIVMALVFVLSFGTLVFAQNTNSSTTGGDMSANTSNRSSMGGRRRGRRHARRRGRRHGRRGGAAKKTGNANM